MGMRPNLFIVGAAKCGTTSLHHALHSHPDIWMSTPKEPGFFVPEFRYLPKDEEWYLSLFADGGECRYRGESSTHYAKRPYYEGVPERVHRFDPDARIVYVMRDPIDRAISHYWHNTRSKREEFHEARPMLEAIREDPNYRHFGDYAMQLEPWLDLFDGRVLTLVYEEMVAAPEATLVDVADWLGLEPAALSLERRNARSAQVAPRSGLVDRFRRSRVWEAIAPLVPKGIRRRARSASVQPVTPAHADESDAVRELLTPWAAEVVERVETLLQRTFPWESAASADAHRDG